MLAKRGQTIAAPVVLNGFELVPENDGVKEHVITALRQADEHPLLVLDTCQRLEVYGPALPPDLPIRVIRHWDAAEAFERLARIAAGLESRILGELEVLGQVREAYRRFREASGGNAAVLDRMFQDALALARKARRESRIDRTLTSLSALAVQSLLAIAEPKAPLAIIGSGALASAVARSLAKRGASAIRVAGRCPENALRLAAQVNGFSFGLDQLVPLLDGVGGIVCATAAPHSLVYPHHLEATLRPLVVVDLGTPPDCSPEVQAIPGVVYIPLLAVEAKAAVNLEERRRKAETAGRLIREGARRWAQDR